MASGQGSYWLIESPTIFIRYPIYTDALLMLPHVARFCFVISMTFREDLKTVMYDTECLSEETLKAIGPFYLVSMSGEVKDPTQGSRLTEWWSLSTRAGSNYKKN